MRDYTTKEQAVLSALQKLAILQTHDSPEVNRRHDLVKKYFELHLAAHDAFYAYMAARHEIATAEYDLVLAQQDLEHYDRLSQDRRTSYERLQRQLLNVASSKDNDLILEIARELQTNSGPFFPYTVSCQRKVDRAKAKLETAKAKLENGARLLEQTRNALAQMDCDLNYLKVDFSKSSYESILHVEGMDALDRAVEELPRMRKNNTGADEDSLNSLF